MAMFLAAKGKSSNNNHGQVRLPMIDVFCQADFSNNSLDINRLANRKTLPDGGHDGCQAPGRLERAFLQPSLSVRSTEGQ
jgi:hypothetical protein